MDAIDIGADAIGPGERPYVIAEAGTNFRDDVELAERLVEEAAAAGADAVKFQTHVQSAEMAEGAMRELGLGDLYERIGRYSLSVDEHKRLQRHCREHGVTFLSTPFSVEGVTRLEALDPPGIKIGSGELTNYHLLDAAAATGKPLLVSTGMADYETIGRSVSFLRERTDEFALLYCVSEYPLDPADFELGVIERLKRKFDVPVGFSDHSRGVEASALAVARGADFVEKHFTIDRRLPGGDQDVSLEPDELAQLCRYATLSHETRGDDKPVTDAETEVANWAHHSVVTSSAVAAGEEFTRENVTTKRPGTGLPAADYFDVLGQRAAEDVEADTVLTDDNLS